MPYEKLGNSESARRARQRAVDAAERVLRNSPDDVRARYLSGAGLVALGRREEGFARLNEAIAIRPTDFSVLYNAACSFAIAGKSDRALELLGTELGMFRNDGPVKPPTLEDLSIEDLEKLLALTPIDADPNDPPPGAPTQ